MALLPLYRSDAIRQIETQALDLDLMAKAGKAAAQYAQKIIAPGGRNVLLLAGPGNNGGDAFEAAVHLQKKFYRVDVLHPADPRRLRGEAKSAFEKWQAAGGTLLTTLPEKPRYDLVIDGLFGIGLSKTIGGNYAALITQVNALPALRLALDIPSGLHADTGVADGIAFRAAHTITFIAHKPGLHTLDGPDYCGEIHLADLGLDARALLEPEGELLDASVLSALPLRRAQNFHKGKAGTLAVIGGAEGMVGAAVLAARAGLKLGAGRVRVGLLCEQPPAFDQLQAELMLGRAELALDETLTAIAAGPGMGEDSPAQRILSTALRSDKPLLLDADALNMIAAYGVLKSAATTRKAPTLMTPHPAEAARLLEISTAQVQADRIEAALMLAQKFKAHVLLKGNGSICASPSGRWWINSSGNPGMASAGMGDVLSGMAGALLAQGVEAEQALLAAVYLHGAAGDAVVAQGRGPIGLTAQEIIAPARVLLNGALQQV